MFSNSANCSSCASISKDIGCFCWICGNIIARISLNICMRVDYFRLIHTIYTRRAQLINDLIRNQHEVVTSLLSERRVSTAARKIATQLRQQNEHLSSECTSISEEYKAALEKLSPLETRVTELENEVSVKCTELEKMRQDLSLAHLSGNGAVTSAQKSDTLEQEKQIRELEDKLREQKAKVSRDTVKKRKCTTKMKDLLRLKGMLGNTVADRIISELASLLEVALKPDEVEALELERQLMAEDRKQQTLPAQQGVGSTPEAQFAYSSASDYSTQTDWSVSNCQTQTSPSSTVTKEVQVGIFEERDSSQIAGLHENDPNSVKYNIVATAAGRSSESQQNEGEKSLLDDKQLTSEHDESRDRLQQADDKRDSAGTSDQAVQVSCSLIDAAIHQSSPESLQLPHTLKITRKDQIVQATCTTLDAAICTVPCRTQEQQQLALDVGTCMSPIRFSPQTCSKCFEKFQGSEVLLSDAVVSEDPSDKAVAAGIKGTSRLGSMDDESNEETKTAKHSDDGHKLELSNEPIEQKLRLSNCHKAEAPRSLLDCIPAIEVDEDRDDPLSPPQGTLIPRKKEKRVSFVDQGVTDGPAHDNSEDSDERIMRELEMIIAEMRHPFANHRDIIRELSPLPPSPVPPSLHSNKRKKKRHREKGADANKPDIDQQPQKRLAHQNSTGFDPLLSSFPSSPALNACWPSSAPTSAQEQCAVPCTGDNRDNTSRLKAEVAHMPESGVTTFSFQIPSGGSSRISIDFDQTTRQLQLSCQTPKMISAPEVLPSSLNEERISSGNYAIQPREGSGRPSLDFSAPSGGGERCWRSPDETLLRRRISTVNNESIQHGSVDQYSQKAGTFVQQLDTRSEVSEQTLQTTYREDSIENSVFDQSEDHTQTNDDFKYVQAKQPWDIAKDHLKEGDKQQRRNVLPIRYPSILKQDRRLKRLSKQRKNKSDSLINDTRKCTPKSSINKSILDAREKMMQRKAKVDRKGPADSDLESYSAAEVCSKNQLVTSNLSTSVLVEEENISNATNDAEIINQDCIDAFSENPEIEGHLEVSLEGDEVGPAIVTARVNEVDVLAGSAGAEQSQNESIDQMEENVSDQIEEPTPALSDAIVNSKESENCQEIIEINAIIDPPPPWVLRNLNGELYQSPIKEDNLSNSDSEEEMCIAVELEDKTFTPMSPEYTEVADRGWRS
ncbi:uncharacterized protein LOC111259600 isoform X1 [Varroa jacobsoni]|uniref:uncharacterized protein LOC111259600 isoform X1 n=1 Tax=Varroa jacobsoni TaxID=62625 RepID=UPI000BF28E18|nr:uncharacterized protein LOC111259600 isoform X1 [Varroa jacobsoni]